MNFSDVYLFASQDVFGIIFTFQEKKIACLKGDNNEYSTCLGCDNIKKAQLKKDDESIKPMFLNCYKSRRIRNPGHS
uniref:Uncharacterized protein n=1 Tax=Romanomermis culicivorax TaxID=13658 RepID=A0A915HWA5_ROMCU